MKIEYQGNTYTSPTACKKIAVEYAKLFCEKEKISFKEISSKCNIWGTVVKRAKVARYLLSFGLTLECVGYALNKHHTQIANYRKPRYD